MRTLHLFHMSYGIAGLTSSMSLHRCDGIVVSMWFVLLGSLPYLGLAPWRLVRRGAG